MAYIFHELIKYVYLDFFFEKKIHQSLHLNGVFSLTDSIWFIHIVFSRKTLITIVTLLREASFLYELIQFVYSDFYFE